MKEHFLSFRYNEYGRGNLVLRNDSLVEYEIEARTGSVSHAGNLVNKIMPGIWSVRRHSVDTTERAMEWEEGYGWKVRMYTPKGQWSRYLIHPDGSGKGIVGRGNGTAGCIGVQGTALQLRQDIDKILTMQDVIKVYVNTPYPKGEL